MRQLIGSIALAAAVLVGDGCGSALESPTAASQAGRVGCSQVSAAFGSHTTDDWLTVRATVKQILPDQHGRAAHQEFIISCPNGSTVLIVNNIDIGQRAPIAIGDVVVAHGEYIWNQEGGLIHFTHHSDSGGPSGWILAAGHVYQ